MTCHRRIATNSSSAAADGPVTLSALADRATTDPSLTPTQRRDARSACATLSTWLCRPSSSVDLRSRDMRTEIAILSAAKLNVSQKRLENVLSAIRSLLKRYSIHREHSRHCSSEWEPLRSIIPERLKYKLWAFITYCSAERIAPTDVDDATVARYKLRLETLISKNIRAKIRDLRIAWNQLADTIANWPQQRLTVPNLRKPRTSIPLELFPASFQLDYQRLRERLITVAPLPEGAAPDSNLVSDIAAGASALEGNHRKPSGRSDPLLDRDRGTPLAETTVDVWMRSVFYAASALVSERFPVEQVVGIATLTEPENTRKILTHYYNKAGRKTTRFTGHLAYILKRVAQIYVRADPATIKTLAIYFHKMQPKQIGLSEKNARNLRDLDNRAKALLLAAPSKLARRALEPARPPHRAAVDLKVAAVVAILLHAPIRGINLCMIEIGRHLKLPNDPEEWGLLHFDAHEVKNRVPITLTLPPEALTIVRQYMKHGRPLLMDPTSPKLFPIAKRKDQDFLNLQVKQRLRPLTGLNVNLHLFRHIAAKMYLDDNQGQYEVVRNVLGQTRIQTTIQAYCGLEREAAIRHFQNEIQKKAGEVTTVRRRRKPTKSPKFAKPARARGPKSPHAEQ